MGTERREVRGGEGTSPWSSGLKATPSRFRIPPVELEQMLPGQRLALELAATWLRVMSAEQIAAELETGFTLLTTSLRNVPQRHRSLAAVFAQSWDLLSPGEQSVLMRLAIFRGGFDVAAATQVAGATLETLAGLCDTSPTGSPSRPTSWA